MAGTVTKSELTVFSVKKVAFTWLSDGTGLATSTTTSPFTGMIQRVIQLPDGGGTQPTTLYDVVVNDSDGVDVLHGLGADLSNAVPTIKDYTHGVGAVVNSTLSLSVTNAGINKGGKTIIYLR